MRLNITLAQVKSLIAAQFPQWADLPITNVEISGWDNRTFRLGDAMSVRMPSAASYAEQVEKEQRWLPRLAPHLPLPIPVPLAMGKPTSEYPYPWSVYRWLEGENASVERIDSLTQFAMDLANFLRALQRIAPDGAPPSGTHNFYRGGSLAVYDAETRAAITALRDHIDTETAEKVWEAALEAIWNGSPVWVHGDVAAGNLLVKDGRLCAVIDFGCSCVGDPACDLTIAWTFFTGESRDAFRSPLPYDSGMWARARGWALWKALITLAPNNETNNLEAHKARHVVDAVLAEHQRGS